MNPSDVKILLVDDDPDILEILTYNLQKEGYQVVTAENGIKAVKKARKEKPDLIVLDVMMPEMEGIQACEQIRSIPELNHVLITFLTARGEDYSQLAGFEVGADDYITKPIKPKLLIGKVASLLRRLNTTESNLKVTVGSLTLDRDAYTVIQNEEAHSLPRKEFELLSLLMSRPGKVFKRDEILNMVWGNDVVVGGRTIDVHIRKLREKIGDDRVETVKGVGYKFSE
jgi:two-component system alkaline phosphatase synthesis response regulator PhoP